MINEKAFYTGVIILSIFTLPMFYVLCKGGFKVKNPEKMLNVQTNHLKGESADTIGNLLNIL
jgi:hypothetical protein